MERATSAELAAMKERLRQRGRILAAIRKFFTTHDFMEVETPVRLPAPALELHLDAVPADGEFLRTSPELHMKRLLAAGYERIFQMGPCFRRHERGKIHHPEFTMLEWYRANADYRDILADMKALIAFVCAEALDGRTRVDYGGHAIELMPVWDVVTVEEAFGGFAGWNPLKVYDADRFDRDMVEKVEPDLPKDHPVILKDYPVEAAALARVRAGALPVAERWELYIGGLELANAFTELADAAEQRRRFEECAQQRAAAGRAVYPMDEAFLAALETGMPPSGGVALGVDRLVMLLTGADSIADVCPFCERIW
jgi:lysyl-tRNA synthetase class 2